MRELTEEVGVSRAVFLKWPMGHPIGEPNFPRGQRVVIERAFDALKKIEEPGTIIDLPFRWKRRGDFEVG